jgi:hypothetical protein
MASHGHAGHQARHAPRALVRGNVLRTQSALDYGVGSWE